MPRQLGKLIEVAQALGLDVTYAYDDLVFVEHNPFLFRFADQDRAIELFFNTQCPAQDADSLAQDILAQGRARDLEITRAGRYELIEKPDHELQIRFLPS